MAIIKNVTIKRASIYSPAPSPMAGLKPKYFCEFEAQGDALHVIDGGMEYLFTRKSSGFFVVSVAAHAPAILADDLDSLCRAYQIAQASNIKPDNFLKGLTADLGIRLFKYSDQTFAHLMSVEIDARNMLYKARSQYHDR